MGRNQRNMINSADTTVSPAYRSGLAYLLIGGGIGATLALLFAPKSGSQLRGDIADVSRKGYEAAAEKAKVLNERSSELVSAVKNKAGSVYDFGKGQGAVLGSSIDDATDTLDLDSGSAKEAGRISVG
jgi:gas vesicle protein